MSGRILDAVILAGGRSRRMGCEKALLELGGETLVERLAHRLGASFHRLLVSSGSEPPSAGLTAALDRLRSAGLQVATVADRRADFAGPLAGVEAALAVIEGEDAFFAAVDIVEMDEPLAERLLAASAAPGSLGAVPRCGGILQGAFAVYSSALLPAVTSLLDGGEARLQSLAGIEGVSVVEVEASAGAVFSGLNTPAEYEAARTRVEDGGG